MHKSCIYDITLPPHFQNSPQQLPYSHTGPTTNMREVNYSIPKMWRQMNFDILTVKISIFFGSRCLGAYIFHIPILYPKDIRISSHNMLRMLNGVIFDPGISDQFTDISLMGILKDLHKYTNSTSKHHLYKNYKPMLIYKTMLQNGKILH